MTVRLLSMLFPVLHKNHWGGKQVVLPNAIARLNGIPSFAWPSDHLALVSQFIVQGLGETAEEGAQGERTDFAPSAKIEQSAQNASSDSTSALEVGNAQSGTGNPGTGEEALNAKQEGEEDES